MKAAKILVLAPALIVLATPAFVLGALLVVGAAPFALPLLVIVAQLKANQEKQPDSVRLLCVEGLESDAGQPLVEKIRAALGRLWAQATPHAEPVVCTCVKRGDSGYYGVLRMRSAEGHALARVDGKSPTAVGREVLATIERFENEFPTLDPQIEEIDECRACDCHLGKQSIFERAEAGAAA